MDRAERGAKVAAALATIAANTTHLRHDLDEHRAEVRAGFASVEVRLKALETEKAERTGATAERRRLVVLGRSAVAALASVGAIDVVTRHGAVLWRRALDVGLSLGLLGGVAVAAAAWPAVTRW